MKTPPPGAPPPSPPSQVDVANVIADATDADIYLYAGSVYSPADRRFGALIRRNRSRKNVLLYLATYGGSADTAYRVARSLQTNYPGGNVSLCVVNYCKSAGTLIALGASELVMSDDAELGPLDVQITKPDSLAERMSGLTPIQALVTLREEAFKCFEKCFLEVIGHSGGQITTRTASIMAVRMTVGLFHPIYAQMDPMRLGEYQRSMMVADQYASRLNNFRNLKENAVARLIADYPSHEFVIDRVEAATLFQRVREPSDMEAVLTRLIEQEAMEAIEGDAPRLRYLCTKKPAPKNEETTHDTPGLPHRTVPPPTGAAGGGTPAPGQPSGEQGKPRRKPRSSAEVGGNGVPHRSAGNSTDSG